MQVRLQEKQHAAVLRNEYKQREKQVTAAVADCVHDLWQQEHQSAISALQHQLDSARECTGTAHRAAAETTEQLNTLAEHSGHAWMQQMSTAVHRQSLELQALQQKQVVLDRRTEEALERRERGVQLAAEHRVKLAMAQQQRTADDQLLARALAPDGSVLRYDTADQHCDLHPLTRDRAFQVEDGTCVNSAAVGGLANNISEFRSGRASFYVERHRVTPGQGDLVSESNVTEGKYINQPSSASQPTDTRPISTQSDTFASNDRPLILSAAARSFLQPAACLYHNLVLTSSSSSRVPTGIINHGALASPSVNPMHIDVAPVIPNTHAYAGELSYDGNIQIGQRTIPDSRRSPTAFEAAQVAAHASQRERSIQQALMQRQRQQAQERGDRALRQLELNKECVAITTALEQHQRQVRLQHQQQQARRLIQFQQQPDQQHEHIQVQHQRQPIRTMFERALPQTSTWGAYAESHAVQRQDKLAKLFEDAIPDLFSQNNQSWLMNDSDFSIIMDDVADISNNTSQTETVEPFMVEIPSVRQIQQLDFNSDDEDDTTLTIPDRMGQPNSVEQSSNSSRHINIAHDGDVDSGWPMSIGDAGLIQQEQQRNTFTNNVELCSLPTSVLALSSAPSTLPVPSNIDPTYNAERARVVAESVIDAQLVRMHALLSDLPSIAPVVSHPSVLADTSTSVLRSTDIVQGSTNMHPNVSSNPITANSSGSAIAEATFVNFNTVTSQSAAQSFKVQSKVYPPSESNWQPLRSQLEQLLLQSSPSVQILPFPTTNNDIQITPTQKLSNIPALTNILEAESNTGLVSPSALVQSDISMVNTNPQEPILREPTVTVSPRPIRCNSPVQFAASRIAAVEGLVQTGHNNAIAMIDKTSDTKLTSSFFSLNDSMQRSYPTLGILFNDRELCSSSVSTLDKTEAPISFLMQQLVSESMRRSGEKPDIVETNINDPELLAPSTVITSSTISSTADDIDGLKLTNAIRSATTPHSLAQTAAASVAHWQAQIAALECEFDSSIAHQLDLSDMSSTQSLPVKSQSVPVVTADVALSQIVEQSSNVLTIPAIVSTMPSRDRLLNESALGESHVLPVQNLSFDSVKSFDQSRESKSAAIRTTVSSRILKDSNTELNESARSILSSDLGEVSARSGNSTHSGVSTQSSDGNPVFGTPFIGVSPALRRSTEINENPVVASSPPKPLNPEAVLKPVSAPMAVALHEWHSSFARFLHPSTNVLQNTTANTTSGNATPMSGDIKTSSFPVLLSKSVTNDDVVSHFQQPSQDTVLYNQGHNQRHIGNKDETRHVRIGPNQVTTKTDTARDFEHAVQAAVKASQLLLIPSLANAGNHSVNVTSAGNNINNDPPKSALGRLKVEKIPPQAVIAAIAIKSTTNIDAPVSTDVSSSIGKAFFIPSEPVLRKPRASSAAISTASVIVSTPAPGTNIAVTTSAIKDMTQHVETLSNDAKIDHTGPPPRSDLLRLGYQHFLESRRRACTPQNIAVPPSSTNDTVKPIHVVESNPASLTSHAHQLDPVATLAASAQLDTSINLRTPLRPSYPPVSRSAMSRGVPSFLSPIIESPIPPRAPASSPTHTESTAASTSFYVADSLNVSTRNNTIEAADRRSVGLRPATEISYRDMRKLTEKLYSRLPEVREKKEQQQKKDEMLQRIQMTKEMDEKRRLR